MKRMHITAASLLAGVLVNCGGGGGVAPSPTVFLQSSVGEVEVGEAVNISWSSSNADSCTASGDWSGNKASSGSESVLIEAPRTYRFALDCSGKGGAYSKSVSVDAFQIISGVSVDGYIRAADIFIDKNDNFTADSGEKISISDDAGSFSIRYSEGNLISLGGFDLDSGVLLDNLLLVNKLDEHIDFAAITPITTVMAFMDIPSDIYFALGIDVSIALASTDPVAMMGDSGIYDFLFEKGNQVTVLALAMQNISNDLNISVDTSQDYFKSIAQELEQGYAETQAKVDIEDRGFIGSVIANIVSSKSLVLSDESQAALAGALASVMSVIEVKDDLAINSALFGFATSTFQSDIKAIANETATEATLNSYRSDFINYISADLNISANDLTPEVRASEDAATTTEDQAVDILVLSNDSLVLSAPFNIVVESPLNGSVEVKSQIVSYTPNPDFNGTDIFSYSVVQGDKSASAVVTIEVAAANDAPSFNNLLPRYTVPENQISVVTILAIDVDEDSLTFSLSGADLESFSLDNQNNLIFKIAPDFESKALYSVSISVSDGAETITKDVAVEISNVNDIAPVIGSSASFSAAENQAGIGSVSASDAEGDALTYSVSGSELAISATGVLSFVSAPDYESKSSYTATVTVSDGVNSATQVVTVTVTNVNDIAPVIGSSASFSAAENQTGIGSVSASDAEGDALTYSVSGSELAISATGVLSFVSAPDYESKSSYTATVTVSDGVNSATQVVTVTVTNVNDIAPVIGSSASFSAAENQTGIGSVSASDAEGDALTYSVSGSELAISATGVLSFVSAPDYETKSRYTATVTVSDGVNSATQVVTVRVTNVNDIAPVIGSSASFSAAENQAGIGSVSASDAEGDALTYSVSGSELAISATGVLSFVSAPDYETKSRYTATVTVSDGVNSATQVVTVTVTNVNDIAPVIGSSASFSAAIVGTWKLAPVAGGIGVGPSAGSIEWWSNSQAEADSVRACLFDDTYTFNADGSFSQDMGTETWIETWQGAAAEGCGTPVAPHDGSATGATYAYDEDSLTINGLGAHVGLAKATNWGELSAGNIAVPAAITYSVDLMAADGLSMTLSIETGSGSGVFWTFKLIKIGSSASFSAAIVGTWKLAPVAGGIGVGPSAGSIEWWSNSQAEADSVRACLFDDTYTFNADGSFSQDMGTETWIETWQGAAAEGCGTPVAPHDGSATGATYAYDEDSLTINGLGAHVGLAKATNWGELSAGNIAVPAAITYSVDLMAADGLSMTLSIETGSGSGVFWTFKLIKIGSSASFSAAENQTGIGSVSASDAEGDALTYSVSGSELAISATGVLSFVSAPDYETKSRYTATVTVSDGVNSATQVVTVTVTNVNDNAPVFSTSAAISAVENKLSIGTIAASDVDGDSLSFSILTGYTELQITSSGSLSFLSTPDYETKSSYSAEVAVSDGAFSVIQNIVVTILLDTDSDGFPDDCDVSCQSWGMSADSDDDNDGVVDASDDYPLNVNVYEAPQATSKSYYMNLKPQSQTAGAVTVAGSVQAGSAKTFSIVTNGSYGTASLNTSTGYMVYTTNSSTQSSQEDTITFKVNDGYVDSSVATISFDLRTDPLYQYQWHLNNTGQTNFASNAGLSGTDLNVDSVISSGVDGEGIVVAVVDSGLEIAHEDLSSNVVIGSWDYVNGDLDPTSSSTDGDHGTSVAGIIAAEGWNKKGGRGVAPKASLVGYNFLAKNSTSNEVNSLGYGNSLAENAGVSIFNMSYGTGLSSAFPTLRSTTIENALLNGVTSYRSGKGAIYVKSSGNDWRERKDTDGDGTGDTSYYCGPNYGPSAEGDSMPCWDASFDNRHSTPYLIGVASLTALNVRSSYSTPGASIWVSGFGGEYGTTDPAIMTVDQETCSKGYVRSGNYSTNTFNNQGNHSSNTDCNYTAKFNGTSAAAPTVSGVVALMLEANPSLTWRDVKHILATTSTQVDTSKSKTYLGVIQYEWETNAAGMKFHNWYGFGRVDAASAVTAAQNYVAGSLNTFIDTGWVDSGNIYDPISTYYTTERSLTVSAPAGASGIVEFVRIKIAMNHAIPNNVGLRLRSPSGTVVNILSPFTRATINPNGVEFELGVNAFYGESMAGSWALVTDEYTNDGTGGTLNSWEIKVYGR